LALFESQLMRVFYKIAERERHLRMDLKRLDQVLLVVLAAQRQAAIGRRTPLLRHKLLQGVCGAGPKLRPADRLLHKFRPKACRRSPERRVYERRGSDGVDLARNCGRERHEKERRIRHMPQFVWRADHEALRPG